MADDPKILVKARNIGAIQIYITATGPDNTFKFETDDYTKETMDSATTFAKELSKNSGDKFTISNGVNLISLDQGKGIPASITDNAPGSNNSFSTQLGDEKSGLSYFVNLSDDFDSTGIKVIKGKANKEPGQKDYITEVIKPINELLGDAELPQNIDKILKNNNRYSNSSQFITIGDSEDRGNFGVYTIHTGFGNHKPNTTITPPAIAGVLPLPPEINNDQVTTLKIKNLRNLGTQILLKASGEVFVADDLENSAQVLEQKGASLVPGLARIGLKVPFEDFRAENIISSIDKNYRRTKNPDMNDGASLSYGSYNNPLAPFDTVDSRASMAASLILAGTIIEMFEALSIVLGPKQGLQSAIIGEILGVVNDSVITTQHDYSECVRTGLRIFFGFGADTSFISGLGESVGKFNDEPGYYNTILRSLTKLIVYEIAGNFVTFIGSTVLPRSLQKGSLGPFELESKLDISTNIGLTNDITSILSIVRRLYQSRLVAWMNTLANIGDTALNAIDTGIDVSNLGTLSSPNNGIPNKDSFSDSIWSDMNTDQNDILDNSLVFRTRLSREAHSSLGFAPNEPAQAWASSTARSMYILPNTIKIAGNRIGNQLGDKLLSPLINDKSFIPLEGTNRISQDIVDAMESKLDTSYVPFYFHDLRTNEIISFHAFLSDVSDRFRAEYAESTGYGRIGKVLTYKNTNREINLSFFVVSTNSDDFDRMWWKINKLVTLLYPQYTEGRQVEANGKKFIQPFSQLPSASPLIRLRLGDLFRSNYSKFGLARLFGAGLNFDNQSGLQETTSQQVLNQVQTERERMSFGDFQIGDKFRIKILNTSPASSNSTRKLVKADNPLQTALQILPIPGGPLGRNSTRLNLPNSEYKASIIGIEFNPDVNFLTPSNNNTTYKVKLEGQAITSGNDTYLMTLGSGDPTQNSRNDQFSISFDDNLMLSIARERIASQVPVQSDQISSLDLAQENGDFFGNDNPIFKAFDSTKGKGLAGFITSLTFDWSEAPWEVDSSKAPMMCKISIDFDPVHDLNPGIDVNGFNTAPVYRVGYQSKAVSLEDADATTSSPANAPPARNNSGPLTTLGEFGAAAARRLIPGG